MTFRRLAGFIAPTVMVFGTFNLAQASLILTLDQPTLNVNMLGFNQTDSFTGTLLNTGPDPIDNITIGAFSPSLYDGVGDGLSFTKTPSFMLYSNDQELGGLLTFHVSYNQPLGAYDSTEPSQYAEPILYFTGTDIDTDQTVQSNGVAYSVNVNASPVPEPATLSVFGLAAMALLVRRRV